MPTSITWESFATYGQDARGVRYKFEDLCRQLFALENVSGNKKYRYLHANPNNYGLETEPIYDEINNRWIGFQAKYFESKVDYNQIKHSAEMTIEYYTGADGKVDIVFLFCNKPITASASGFIATKQLLQKNGISIQLVTDTAILDLVRTKYPHLGLYYFGNHTIEQAWFERHSEYMYDELGDRFNQEFNVETECSVELSLFVHDQRAAEYLNAKKNHLLQEISRHYYSSDKEQQYLNALESIVKNLSDVDQLTLHNATNWKETIIVPVSHYIAEFGHRRESLLHKQEEQVAIAYDFGHKKDEREAAIKESKILGRQIRELDTLINLVTLVDISERERKLLYDDVIAVYGEAGTGKSQLLAYETKKLIDNKRPALLLVAGMYYTSEPIQDQIMKNLGLEYSLDELIDILEALGERENCIIPIFVDALNETWNRFLWKSGLPAIIAKVQQSPMVKLVITYRPEYEKLIMSDSMIKSKREGDLLTMVHAGFEDNSTEAVRAFLNQYNIPFTALEYFGYEMSNPLFLSLYCKTYSGEEVDLPTLYERLLTEANQKIHRAMEQELAAKGYAEDYDLLRPLITELASLLVEKDERSITQPDLCGLRYWSQYGLIPAPFIDRLIKESILHDSTFEGVEHLFFAYDQMNDYYCAKVIIEKYGNKEDVRRYLLEKVLEINSGALGKPWNIDLFINSCALYAEKFGEECIDIIDRLSDDDDKWSVFSKYIASFQWRKSGFIPAEKLVELLKTYPCRPEDLWEMLIGNSVKVTNPLNADFLHAFLSSYELCKRDYLWTTYINQLPSDPANRIVQLVEMYDRGEKLDTTSEKQIILLLTLFSWILTSSNRWLRDYTSKAMIEILKEHFYLCEVVLRRFEKVNDPYVVQRLYAIVFGACCKKSTLDKEVFEPLAEFVYDTIFDQEKVYPDILLRDYAREIIERFLFENPTYFGRILHDKIVPPYNSDPIPEIEDQHYLEQKYDGATFWLIHSMCFEGMGMYGDFGRYVFQSALKNFDVDDKKIFNYAVYYIFNELKFSEDYFGEHDKHCGSFDRHCTAKTERIGKKYQWITMYNILARVSDHCQMIDRWSYPKQDGLPYDGPWEPYVRDFDPTLNQSFMVCSDAPLFEAYNDFTSRAIEENGKVDISNKANQINWLEEKGVFHNELKDILILRDGKGTEWVTLTAYLDTGRKHLDTERLLVWGWLYAYFVTQEQKLELIKCSKSGLSVITSGTASHCETYAVFNREFPWAPSCRDFKEYAWVDATVKTGEKVKETVSVPDFSFYEDSFLTQSAQLYKDETHDDDNGSAEVEEEAKITYKTISRETDEEKPIGKILHATSTILWEEEYDATKETAISWNVPCAEIIETLKLRQLKSDGFFFDENDTLAAFDVDLTQKQNCFVIRKDLLDRFLNDSNLELVWLVDSSKEIHAYDRTIEQWSEWEAVFSYEDDSISGELYHRPF